MEELAGATGERKMMVNEKGKIDHWKHTDAELKKNGSSNPGVQV